MLAWATQIKASLEKQNKHTIKAQQAIEMVRWLRALTLLDDLG